LVGGHTIEGPQLTAGFTILADQGQRPLRAKGGLRVGDRLVLTKRLGSGILLAAHMRALCKAPWLQELLQSMLLSNRPAAALAEAFDIVGITDITGFGLAGHLLEMLRAGNQAAEVNLDQVPLFPGVVELLTEEHIESTLAPANRAAEDDIDARPEQKNSPRYAALFDPQTCGGLLLGVPAGEVSEIVRRLEDQAIPAVDLGVVVAHEPGRPRLRLS
jgi:selenide,water dikinase